MKTFQRFVKEDVTVAQGKKIRDFIDDTKKDPVRDYAVACFNLLIQPGKRLSDLEKVALPTGLKSSEATTVRKWFKAMMRPHTDADWLPGMETIAKFSQGIGAKLDREPITEAFTRQHYEALAKLIKELGDAMVETRQQEEMLENFASKLADFFKQDNPRFDKGFFLSKCGV